MPNDPNSPSPNAFESPLTGLASSSWPRRVFAYTIFPLSLALALAVTYVLYAEGAHATVAVFAGIALGTLGVAVGERVQPRTLLWARSYGDLPIDLKHIVFSQLLPSPFVEFGLAAVFGALAVSLAEQLGRGLWPVSVPLALQVVLGAIIGELGQYGWHRLCHENAWFWRFHATHHSAPRLWWVNAARFHPLDSILSYTVTVVPLLLLGCPPMVMALLATLTAVHGVFQHANVDLRLGPLNWVFSMAELHRWHHSRTLSDANSNYGANVIFWDVVFGTRHLPSEREHHPSDVGFHGVSVFPQTYLGQLWSPFRWRELNAEVEAAAATEAEASKT